MQLGKKMTVGYTTGVFDIFHQGHLNLLRNAKEYCDFLIVGVSTDELCVNFKSKKPAVPFAERIDIVGAIRYVDKVVPQDSMDKYKAWQKNKFNILFASQSPTKKWPQVETEFLKHFKGNEAPRIIRLPYTPGISSTIRRSII